MRASFLPRSPLLLLAVALMAVAAFVAPGAQPAQAQTATILSATLRASQISSDHYGCTDTSTSGRSCTPAALLTDNTFNHNGVSYEIDQLFNDVVTNTLDFSLTTAIPASLKSALTLYLDDRPFALADATTITGGVRWSNAGLSWISGTTVNLKLTGSYPAELDPDFGIGGKVTTPFNTKRSEIYAVAEQSDGKIVAVGWVQNATKDFALARYNTDGSLDTAFGTGGRVTTDIGAGNNDEARAVAIQSDGKIVVAGYANDGDATNPLDDFALARYNTDGSLDTKFGSIVGVNRTGKLTTSMGATDIAHAVAIQSDGKIVLAGKAGNSFGVARYHPSGDPDEDVPAQSYTGFAGNGRQTTDFTTGIADRAHAVAIQSDGKIVLAGYATNNNGTTTGANPTDDDHKDFALARYTTAGALDTSFGTGGKVTSDGGGDDEINAVALDGDGKIIAAGYTWAGGIQQFAVARYTSAGALDTAFDTDGKVITDFHNLENVANAVAIDSGGKIVVAGFALNDTPDIHAAFAVARYNSDGSSDTTFDSDGKAATQIGNTGLARGVAIAVDGSIIAAGYSNTGSVNEFALVGYTSAGALNGRFGIGGVVTTGFSGTGSSGDEAHAVAIDGNDKIVVAGYTLSDTALARYNVNGSLDTAFGTRGRVVSNLSSNNRDRARAVAIQPDDKIVVAGYANSGTDDDILVARYETDGSLDTGFGTGGRTLSGLSGEDRAYATALLDSGKILVVGEAGGNFILKRFNADGSADTGFQTAGKVTTHMGGSNDVAYAVAVQPDGKIVLVGYASNGANEDFALARYTAAGALDTTFSGDGKALTDFNGGDDRAFAVALQPNGKIVVAGYAHNGTNTDFALARYNANGTLDSTFGTGGKVTTPMGDGASAANAMELQANGRIVVAGYAVRGGAFVFALARYNTDGTLDTGFDAGGTGKALTSIGAQEDRVNAMAFQSNGKIVVAGNSHDGAYYDFAVARYLGEEPVSTDATLRGLAVSASANGSTFDRTARLKPAFAPGTTIYEVIVQDDVTHVKVTPTAGDARATITVNGQTATSGSAGGAIAVTPGTTTLSVVVTAADGTTTQTYTISFATVSTDATLSGLSVSASADGTTFDRAPSLSPSFSSGTLSYALTVRDDVSHMKVTPTTSDAGATVTVNNATVSSGSASGAVSVSDGATVSVVVTAGDDVNTQTYTVTVNFEYDATLRGLAVSGSTDGATFAAAELRPDFSPGTTDYRVAVENDNSHVKVTPTTTITGATVTVNGATVTSGSASAAIAASQGDSVTVVVTGTDGSTTVTYTLELAPRGRGIRLYAEGPTTVLEGESVRFWVSPPPLDRNVSIPVTVTAGTAESGDYQELTSVATVASQHGGTGVIRTYHDADQDDETFTVSVDESKLVALGLLVDHPNSVTFTIRDDDKPSPVSISVLPERVREGESAQIAVVIAESKSQNVSIPITVTSSSGESGDYSAPSSIVIRRGETVGTGALRALQDADAVDEILTVALGSNLPALATAGTPSSAQVTIDDDEAESQVFIKRIEPDPVPEGETAYVVLGISPTQPGRVTIPITFTHLTSEAGDFRLPASITFNAGQPEGVGELRALQDSDADDERLNVELGSNLPDLVTADSSASVREVTIKDDEAAFEVIIKRIEPNLVREGETAHVVLGISPTQPQRVTIPITFTHGSSESGDFRLPASITFDAGQPEAVGELRALQDSDSDDETLTVALGSSLPDLATAGTPSQVQVTIDDDEFVSRVWFKRVVPGGVPEGDTAGVVLGIEPAQPERVTIPVTITHVSSESGDFQSLSSITFEAGQPEAVGEIRTRQDSDEDDEVLEVALGSSLPALVTAGTPASIRVTIKDDDGSGGGGGGGGGGNDAAPLQQPLPRVERGNASLEVTWIIKDDHSPYTGFDVAYRQKGTTGWTDAGHSGTARRHTISSLTNGTTYQVRVRAKIGSAEGPWSWMVAEGTPVAPPAAPTGLTASAANRQQTLDVSWTAPAGEVTAYRVEYREDGSQEWLSHGEGRDTSRRIWSLKDGTTYNVRVRALIDSIEGPWATASGATRPAP